MNVLKELKREWKIFRDFFTWFDIFHFILIITIVLVVLGFWSLIIIALLKYINS